MIAVLNDQSGNGCAAGVASLISGVPDPFNQVSKGMSMEWKDQYKHPNWQKRRLERLEFARWECESCGSPDDQLHVHHSQYLKGRKIWEYADNELQVLCEKCHSEAHATLDKIKAAMSVATTDQLEYLLGVLQGLQIDGTPNGVHVESYEHAAGVGAVFRVTEVEVIESVDDRGYVTAAALADARREMVESIQGRGFRG